MSAVEPPSQKIGVLTTILKFLCGLSFLQGLILLSQWDAKAVGFMFSCVAYRVSWHKYSYFACICNQMFSLTVIGELLLEMASKLQNGLYKSYLSSEGIYKMSSLVCCIIAIYFNFSAYQAFKQLALEMYNYENSFDSPDNP